MFSNNMDDVNSDTLIDSDEYQAMSHEKKNQLFLLIILCISIISIGLCIYYFINYFQRTKIKYDDGEDDPKNALYGCICDAGSSGTRVSVYRWPKRKENIIPRIKEVNRSRTNPGIHEMNETKLEESMNHLIGFCKEIINKESQNHCNLSDASFYLKATAGMRSISEEKRKKKLDFIRNIIRKSNLKFLKDDWVKVIDGNEEGLFGWISVNYLNDILFKNQNARRQIKMPYGSIDLGGYSLEITFSTNETIKEHNINLNFTQINYNIYSYSFQNYGQSRFKEILMEHIIKNSSKHGSSNIIENPCYLVGYNETYKLNNINYTFVGKTNISLCQQHIKFIMNLTRDEDKEKSINKVYQPKIPEDLKFYGISGLYWIAKTFKIAGDDFHSASELLAATDELCKKNWGDAIIHYKVEEKDKKHFKGYCSAGYYIYYFLVEGFKIDKEKKIFNFPAKINNNEVGWTLGAMSYEIGLLPL